MNLRKAARGRPCMVRLPGCAGGGEDTVLAHFRMPGLNGTGMKPDDAVGAWACSECHSLVDGRSYAAMPRKTLRLYHAEGVLRTIAELRKEGAL